MQSNNNKTIATTATTTSNTTHTHTHTHTKNNKGGKHPICETPCKLNTDDECVQSVNPKPINLYKSPQSTLPLDHAGETYPLPYGPEAIQAWSLVPP